MNPTRQPSLIDHALSPIGSQLLEHLPPYHPDEGEKIAAGLRRRGIAPELVAAIMTQRQLRYQAAPKFDIPGGLNPAQRMLFTRAGMEQATRLVVALRHAQRYRDADCSDVADLGCGIGADSLALAGLGIDVTAVDRDPDHAAATRHNLRLVTPDPEVICADVTDLDLTRHTAIFADPARRAGNRRLSRPQDWSPSLDTILGWESHSPRLGIKVAPGIDHQLIPPQWGAQWVSVDGEVVECGLWSPPLNPGGERYSALVIHAGEHHTLRGDTVNPPVGPLAEWLIDPDGAIIRARALHSLAAAIGATTIHPTIAYLTGPRPAPRWAGKSYRIITTTSLKEKQIRHALGAHHATAVTILKRGTDHDPATLRRKILPSQAVRAAKESGQGQELVLILTRVAHPKSRHIAIIAQADTPGPASGEK